MSGKSNKRPNGGKVRILCGANASARAAAVDAAILNTWDHAVLIVPTREQARRRRESIVLQSKSPGCWGEPVCEFNDFARRILESEGVYPVILDNFRRRLLVENRMPRILEEAAFAPFRAAAATPGFAAQILSVIAQLKQAAIDPGLFQQRLAQGNAQRKIDGLVSRIYREYQEDLLDAGFYDIPGLYWEADLRCREGCPALLEGVELLCLDGFDDFTPSQARLIESAAAHVACLILAINYDEDPGRRDLYELPARAVELIAARYRCVPEYFTTPTPARYSEFAARKIFWRDPPVLVEGMTPDLKVACCAEPAHEIETIARRVKRLMIANGVMPDRIAVVFRQLSAVAATVRAIFREMGIPVRVIEPISLSGSATGVFLQRIGAALGGWEREAVLDLLASPLLGHYESGATDRGAWPLVARHAGALDGFESWRNALTRLITRLQPPMDAEARDWVRRFPALLGAAEALLRQVDALAGHWRDLPEEGTLAEHVAAFERFLDALGVAIGIEALEEPARTEELAAFAALRQFLGELANGSPRRLTRNEFWEHLTAGVREATFRPPAAKVAVAVYDAPSVRNLSFDHVFFAGLNEGACPLPGPVSAIYPEGDLAGLRDVGIHLGGQGEHSLRERLLFQHVLETAKVSLTLSWSLQSAGGKPASPSPFLKEVVNLFPAGAVEETAPRSDTFVPEPAEVSCRRDLQNALFHHTPALCASPVLGCAALNRAAHIERDRLGDSAFGEFDGILANPRNVAWLADRYGTGHCFSVSRLETYLGCPFRFFEEYILQVDEVREPSEEMDPMQRGLLLHDLLRRFHEQFAGRSMSDLEEPEAERYAARAIEEAFAALAARSSNIPMGAIQLECQRMAAILRRYVRIERDREKEHWHPVVFEASFGGAPPAENSMENTPGPAFAFHSGAGPVLFSGRIDRIDEAGASIRVIDYKSAVPPAPKDILEGRSIQLGIYALAAESEILPGRPCSEALFLQPGTKRKTEALGRDSRKGSPEERRRILEDAVARAVTGIRQGCFPPLGEADACRACGQEKACRYEKARIERKSGQQAAAAGASDSDR